MASTIKKSKAKASPIKSSSTKVKSKTKVAKPAVKVKRTIAKAIKSKQTKPMKTKAIAAKPVKPKKAPVKKVIAKTKVKTKMPIKKLAPKTKLKAKPKTVEPIKIKPAVTKKSIETTTTKTKPEQKAELAAPIPEAEPVPMAEYMDEAQLLKFRHMLEQWKRELMEEVDNTITEMKEAGVQADPNDCATQEETFSLELRTRDRERKLLRKIEETLKKIDNDEYGYCDTCGVEIGIRRLEARPTANLCIDCKTLDEIKEKRA